LEVKHFGCRLFSIKIMADNGKWLGWPERRSLHNL
jgi:hypothetical protein